MTDTTRRLRQRQQSPQARPATTPMPGLGDPPVHPDEPLPNPSVFAPVTQPGDEPGTYTENDLDIKPEVNARISAIMREGIAYAHKHQGTVQGESMLDDTIYQMRLMGLSTREISQRLNGTVTEQEVARRIGLMLARMDELSPAEYRQLQIGRSEAIVNFLWAMARGGSADHIELLIKAIERLNKMFDLETEKQRIEIELITTHQATLLMSVVGGVLQVILGDQRVLHALTREEVNSLAAEALDAAGRTIASAQSQVLVPANDPNRSTSKLVLSQRP